MKYESDDFSLSTHFWFYLLAGMSTLAILAYAMKLYIIDTAKAYVDGALGLHNIHQHEKASRKNIFSQKSITRLYPVPIGQDSNIYRLLKDAMNSKDISRLITMLCFTAPDVARFILTLRAHTKLEMLNSKFDNYFQRKPFTPFSYWELNALSHMKDCAEFWQDVANWLNDEARVIRNENLLSLLQERLLLIQNIKRLLETYPDYKEAFDMAACEPFKNAHIAILDSRPTYEIFEGKPGLFERTFIENGYSSAAALSTTSQRVTMWNMAQKGFVHEPLTVEKASVYLPFKIDLKALLPEGLNEEQINKLESSFDEDFQNRIKHEIETAEDNISIDEKLTYSTATAITSRFWPNWGVPKQSFRHAPLIGNPKKQICSTLLAQDLWKSLQMVDKQLEKWQFQPLKNPFGEYQRLDTLLPAEIVNLGVKYGWLKRMRNLDAEQLILSPQTPTGGKECLTPRNYT